MKNTRRLELALKDEYGNIIDLVELKKQIRADAIDEAKDEIVHHLNDYALQEAPIYQDDMANQRPVYLAIQNCINGVIEIAEKLKEQK